MWKSLYILSLLYCFVRAEVYTTYYGEPATEEEIADFTAKNIANICTATFEACDETELRRVDGSCNNLDHPSHGMFHTRQWRLLEANYSDNFTPKKTKSGKDYPLARYIRTHLIKTGETINEEIAMAASYFAEFSFIDVGSVHDISLYIFINTHCCLEEGLSDSMCAPNYVPYDDPVHRFSNIRCLNMTKPLTYQNRGCVANDTVPERINFSTAHFDISNIYIHKEGSTAKNRAYEGGRLKVETYNGRIFPSDANENSTCLLLDSIETDCARDVPNGLIGTNLCSTWFWRMHNHIADGLAEVNPTWDDETLFRHAMDINVGYYSQILFYEYYALMLGKQNMIDNGIISSEDCHRDPYDATVLPSLCLEYAYALRWFHITQNGVQRMYDKDDVFTHSIPVTNFSARVHYLAIDDNMVGMTHGSYMEAAGEFGKTAHPVIADASLGRLAVTHDLLTADLSRGKAFGLASYIEYRDMCTDYQTSHQSFEDLAYLMDSEYIELLQLVYEDVSDIDLLAGIWLENLMEGAWVPPTVYCIVMKQLARSVVSDRHWYERADRPNYFTEDQLAQIRQASFAGLLCTVGDDVSEIQPEAFRRISSDNQKVSCDEIPQLDLSFWAEDCEEDY